MNEKSLIARAMKFDSAGDPQSALSCLTELLTEHPISGEAMLFRGVIQQKLGRPDLALADYDQALKALGQRPEIYFNRASCLRDMGDSTAAELSVDRALALSEKYADAYWLKAILRFEAADYVGAGKLLKALHSLNPNREKLFFLLGLCASKYGKTEEALLAFREGLKKDGPDAELLMNYAIELMKARKTSEAKEAFNRAIDLQPGHPDLHLNYGIALKDMGDYLGALQHFRLAAQLNPNFGLAHYNIAIALHELGDSEGAFVANEEALRLSPNLAVAHVNRGAFLHLKKDYVSAAESYTSALALDAENAGAKWNLALIKLTLGEYRVGFELYENRVMNEALADLYSERIPIPTWRGESDPTIRNILVLHEQGLGDTIQFSRFLYLIAERGFRITIVAPRPLHRLLAQIPGVDEIAEKINLPSSIDRFCYIMSLPQIFRTTLETIPFGSQAYLFSDDLLKEKWAQNIVRLIDSQRQPKVGVMWRGGSASKIRGRSMTAQDMVLLLGPNYYLVSLQKELPSAEADFIATRRDLIHFGHEQEDFADTAALIDQLDLVVTVDTSVAHLAGALGKETWVLLPFSADWRWLESRDDSPWYPNMRLFRQSSAGEWGSVLLRVKQALEHRFSTVN